MLAVAGSKIDVSNINKIRLLSAIARTQCGMRSRSFEGVCVTTVILAPGACGGGLRAAVLDTTSVASVAKVAKVLCSRRLDFVGRHRKR